MNYLSDRTTEEHVFISPLKNNVYKLKQKEGVDMKLFTLDEALKLKMVGEGNKNIILTLKKIL